MGSLLFARKYCYNAAHPYTLHTAIVHLTSKVEIFRCKYSSMIYSIGFIQQIFNIKIYDLYTIIVIIN